MNRFRNHRLHVATLLLLLGALPSVVPAAEADRPNVLFLAIDDLNDWTGSLGGYDGVQTPQLDRLAAMGTMFTRAYCAAPACNPSRVSLLTGLRPSTTGIYHNPQPWRPVLRDAVTLPQHFMAAGYNVIGGGKIFHGSYRDDASWHTYFKRPGDPAPPGRPINGIPKTAHFDWGPVKADDKAMGDMILVDWALDYLNEPHDKPFFLAVGIQKPHLPWFVPTRYFKRYPLDRVVLPKVKDDDLDDIPPMGRDIARPEGDHARVLATDNWAKAVQGYLATITFVDTCVGRLLDGLAGSRHADNTIIVMWSDHGWHLGEKLHWRKFTLWEEATRMPMVIVAPGVTSPGQRCDRTVTLLDLYPTLVDLCGLADKPELEGDSLLPLLKHPAADWDRPAVTTHGQQNHAVRSERYRYIRYQDGTEELYDHDNDPMEWTNLADRPELAGVKHDLARWLPKTNVPNAPFDKKARKRAAQSAKKRSATQPAPRGLKPAAR